MLRVAVVGYGYWGPNLVRNFNESEHTTTAIVCDTDEARLAKARDQSPGAQVTARFEEVLTGNIDAVAIATPVATHYELARRALEAGKHVLVEKPFTILVEQAEELVTLAERAGRVLLVDHVFVYSPAVQKIKELVDAGHLGRLYFIDSVRINLGLFQHDVNVAWDLAPHDLSIVDHLFGRLPRSVAAMGSSHTSSGLEDAAYLNLDYGEGLRANFHVNWLSPVKVRQMIVGGSERSIIYNDMDTVERVKVYDRGIDVTNDPESRRRVLINYRSGDVWSPQIGPSEPLGQMVDHFADCILTGTQPLTGGDSAVRVVRILDAAQRSIKADGGRVLL
jgi:predicted dehydrogenase